MISSIKELSMKKKPSNSNHNQANTQKVVVSLFFVMTSLGITVLSLLATSKSADIRQQAQLDVYSLTPAVPSPTIPIPSEIPTKIPSKTPIKEVEKPAPLPTSPEKPSISPSKSLKPTEKIEPSKVPSNSPKPTQKTSTSNTTTSEKVSPNPLPSKPTVTTKTTTNTTTSTSTTNTTTAKVSETPKTNSVASAPQLPQQVMQTVANITTQTVTTNAAAQKAADERLKAFLEMTTATTITTTTNKAKTQSTAGSQVAKNVLNVVDRINKPNTNSTAGSTNNNTMVSQNTSISSQQTFHPAVYIPENEVITKVAQVGAVNSALLGGLQHKENVKIVVQDLGKLVSHTIPVPKSPDGSINQAVLQSRVATAVSQPNTGTAISSKSVENVKKEKSQSTSGTITNAFNAVSLLFGGKPAQETAAGVKALKEADLVVQAGNSSSLPIQAQQINVNFTAQNIVINQTSNQNLNKALGEQIAPVTQQLQVALGARAIPENNSIGSAPVINTQQTSTTAHAVATKTKTDESQVVKAATIQTLAKQLGVSAANVEYVSNNVMQKAYIVTPAQNSSAALSASTGELAAAVQGKPTVGEQIGKFSQSNGLGKALTSLAFPGVDKLAKEPTLQVQVIHINGDLNTQPALNIKADTASNTNNNTKTTSAPNQPKAVIVVDDYGNQKVHVFGNTSADQLQAQIQSNPSGLLDLINSNLQNALNN